jgi:hypothetical protein
MTSSFEALDDVVADPLVIGVVHGDRAAWFELTLHIEAWVQAHVPRNWRMRRARLHGSEDDVRDVLLETLERLDRDDFRTLRQYLERKRAVVPDVRAAHEEAIVAPTFVAWLAGLVDFAIRDHVRRRYGRAPTGETQGDAEVPVARLSKRSLQSWAVHPTEAYSGRFGGGAPAGMSRMLTARSILAYAAESFDERELSVFQRYLEQASFEELAQEFAFAGEDAVRAEIRKLKERLRARFRDAE